MAGRDYRPRHFESPGSNYSFRSGNRAARVEDRGWDFRRADQIDVRGQLPPGRNKWPAGIIDRGISKAPGAITAFARVTGRRGSRIEDGIFAEQIRSMFEVSCRRAGINGRPGLSTAAFRKPREQLQLSLG